MKTLEGLIIGLAIGLFLGSALAGAWHEYEVRSAIRRAELRWQQADELCRVAGLVIEDTEPAVVVPPGD